MLKCKLKVILAIKEMKSSDFAKVMGINPSTASSWISGKAFPSLEKAYEVARVLGVPVTDVWVDESNEPPLDMQRFMDLDKALDDYFKKG